ncbi:MAG: metal-dependent hydrolase [Acidiferrobacterales bacterium]
MPLPLAHSAAGVASYLAFSNRAIREVSASKKMALLLFIVAAANIPDLDFLPGILIGKPGYFHHGGSHSLTGAALLAFILLLLTQRYFPEIPITRMFLLLSVAVASHSVLDFFSADTSPPFGVPLFGPLSSEYYISPVPVFLDVVRVDTSNLLFFTTLLNLHNVLAAVLELLFGTAMISAVLVVQSSFRSVRFWRLLGLFSASTSLFILVRLLLR